MYNAPKTKDQKLGYVFCACAVALLLGFFVSVTLSCSDGASKSTRSNQAIATSNPSGASPTPQSSDTNGSPIPTTSPVAGSTGAYWNFTAGLSGPLDITYMLQHITADATVTLTSAENSETIDIKLQNVHGGLAAISSDFNNAINGISQPSILTIVPADQRQQFFAAHPEWKDLDCVVIPVTKVANDKLELRYDPAVPMIVTPQFEKSACSAALKSKVTFSNIKATLVKHFSSAVEDDLGKTSTGTATVSWDGGSKFTFEYNFGDELYQKASTLFAKAEFTIDSSAKNYKTATIYEWLDEETMAPLTLSRK